MYKFFFLFIYFQVGQLKKFGESKGLGISLEGTVDVEDGQEVRPHHYIRSILPEGPVGQNGKLRSGDELLEVKIFLIFHILFFVIFYSESGDIFLSNEYAYL